MYHRHNPLQDACSDCQTERRDETHRRFIGQKLDRGFWKNLHHGQSIAHPESSDATLGVYSRNCGHNRLCAPHARFRVQGGTAEVWWPCDEENLETIERSCGCPRHCSRTNGRLNDICDSGMRRVSLTCARYASSHQKFEGSHATKPAVVVIVVVLLE
jgi:hypothetical protein